jgi:hypothetical protein
MSRNQVIAVVILAGTVAAALGAVLDLPQKIEVLYRRIRPKSDIVQFQSLDRQALLRFGASFSYPQGWPDLMRQKIATVRPLSIQTTRTFASLDTVHSVRRFLATAASRLQSNGKGKQFWR